MGGGGGGWWWFPAITLSQPSYSYGCFVVGVVVVVGLLQQIQGLSIHQLCDELRLGSPTWQVLLLCKLHKALIKSRPAVSGDAHLYSSHLHTLHSRVG